MFDYPRLFSYKIEYGETYNGKEAYHNVKGVVLATSLKAALNRVYEEYDPKIVPCDTYRIYSLAIEEQDEIFHFVQEIEHKTEEW